MPWTERPPLAARIALAMGLVALVAVLLTGLVAVPLVGRAAEEQARRQLAASADLVATTVDRRETLGRQAGLARLRALLRRQQVELRLVGPRTVSVLEPADEQALLAGQELSGVRRIGGRRHFVEGRPAGSGAVVLLQPASVVGSPGQEAARVLFWGLAAGLAGGALAGLALAWRLARPLQHAASAARELAAGGRDVRVAPEGPAEVADVAEAINGLAAALAASEGRQRDFLLSVSHELRTPLTAVRGYAEALSDDVVPATDVRRTGRTMLAEAQRLERLVSDLMDLARLGAQDFPLDLARVDLVDLVRRAAEVWRDRCQRESAPLRLELPEAPAVVTTDPTRVRQILDGLAENALRVTPPGRPLVFALRTDPHGVSLEVRDGGPGLTDDDVAVAFERWALHDRYRGERRVGTGIGLALVDGLTRRLGGWAVAGHAPEGGAAFTIRLPLDPSYEARTLR
jgi:two-component system, OmpR family, sensor kinase